jgi:hypothetical protein
MSSTPCVAVVVLRLVARGGLEDAHLSRERRTRNAILFRGPRSEIRDLTTLGTEWTPRVCIPRRGSAAKGAGHGCSVTSDQNEVQALKHRSMLEVLIVAARSGATVALGFDPSPCGISAEVVAGLSQP